MCEMYVNAFNRWTFLNRGSLISISPALRDEEDFRSPMMLEEESNDEWRHYGEDGDTEGEDEILEDENAILGTRVDAVSNFFTAQV